VLYQQLDTADVSAMRVMALISLLSAIGMAFYGIAANKDLSALSILCGIFVSAAFAGKVLQKNKE
jgi:hypothetical protein